MPSNNAHIKITFPDKVQLAEGANVPVRVLRRSDVKPSYLDSLASRGVIISVPTLREIVTHERHFLHVPEGC